MSALFDTIPMFFQILPELMSGLFSVVGAASAVTALTPSPRDDHWVARIYKILQFIALNIGHAGEKPRR